jgi:tetratricopeptide (TPR) repeat protein
VKHAPTFLAAALAVAALIATPVQSSAQRFQLPAGLKDLEQAARRDSNDAAAHYSLALAYWNEKRWDAAERALKTAVAIEPAFASAHLALSSLPYARRPRLYQEVAERGVPAEWKPVLEEAGRYYRLAFLLDPFCDVRVVGSVLPETSVLHGGRAQFALEFFGEYVRGLVALLDGNYDQAYVGFQRSVNVIDGERHPDRVPPALHWWRAIAAAHTQRWDVAEADLEVLVNGEQDLEESNDLMILPLRTNEFRYVLAVIKDRAGQRDEAWSLYQEALEHDVGLYMANVQLARLHEGAREWDLAIKERQAAMNANPDDPSLLYDLGVAFARGGRWVDAEQTLVAAVDANPRDTRALYYLGIVRTTLNQPAEARQAFERFVSLAPSRYGNQIADAKRRLESLP